MELFNGLAIVLGCVAIFQLGRAYELSQEIRRRSDELEAKFRD